MTYPSIWPEIEEAWVRGVPEGLQRDIEKIDPHVRLIRNTKHGGFMTVRRCEARRDSLGRPIPSSKLNDRMMVHWFPIAHFKRLPSRDEVRMDLWERDSWRDGNDKEASIDKAHDELSDAPLRRAAKEEAYQSDQVDDEAMAYVDASERGRITVSGSGKNARVSDLRRAEA